MFLYTIDNSHNSLSYSCQTMKQARKIAREMYNRFGFTISIYKAKRNKLGFDDGGEYIEQLIDGVFKKL